MLETQDGTGLKPISCSDCGSTELQGGAAIRLYVTEAFALGIVVRYIVSRSCLMAVSKADSGLMLRTSLVLTEAGTNLSAVPSTRRNLGLQPQASASYPELRVDVRFSVF